MLFLPSVFVPRWVVRLPWTSRLHPTLSLRNLHMSYWALGFLVEIQDFQGLVREILGGFQGSEVQDTSHGVQGGPGRPKKLRSEPLVSYSNDFLSKR